VTDDNPLDATEGLPALLPEQPRDPTNGRYVSPEKAPPAAAAEPPAEPPKHSFYALQSAHHLGIPQELAASMTPETLERLVASLQANPGRQPAAVQEPPAPAPETIDWGEGPDGNPLTEEQAKKTYVRPVFNAIKNGARVEQLEKQLTQERQSRQAENYQRSLDQLYRTRPELFGNRPPRDPFSPEGRRRRQVENEIAALVQAGRQDNLQDDWTSIVADLFGAEKPPSQSPAQPEPRPTRAPSRPDPAAAYARAELARPTARRAVDTRSERDRRIDDVAAQLRERGVSVPSPTTDDDLDLPAYDYDQPKRR
jgi:hypothetical protein